MTRVPRYCIACGCTWSTACPGSCAWVAADRCSACADVVVTRPLTPHQAAALRDLYLRSANPVLGGTARRIMADHIRAGRASVGLTRSGRFTWRMTPAGRRFLAGQKRLAAYG